MIVIKTKKIQLSSMETIGKLFGEDNIKGNFAHNIKILSNNTFASSGRNLQTILW